MELSNESKTLFIPLLCKDLVSKQNIFLQDKKAEEIIEKVDYAFKALKQSKWLSMYMSLRALLLDELCNKYLLEHPNTTVIHLGCGLDSRCLRLNQEYKIWYDVDFDSVIDIRKNFFKESVNYKMIGSSVTEDEWLDKIVNTENILIVMEGLTMYLSQDEICDLIRRINNKFGSAYLIFDAYTKKGVKGSKIKNPVNQMNAQIKYGIDNYQEFLELNDNLEYIDTHLIKKDDNNLKGLTKLIFDKLFCGVGKSFYRMYEFKLHRD